MSYLELILQLIKQVHKANQLMSIAVPPGLVNDLYGPYKYDRLFWLKGLCD